MLTCSVEMRCDDVWHAATMTADEQAAGLANKQAEHATIIKHPNDLKNTRLLIQIE